MRVAAAGVPRRVGGGANGSRNGLVSVKFEVVVPSGAAPGDTLYVQLPTGEEVRVVLPPEGAPGSRLTCSTLARQPPPDAPPPAAAG